MRRRSSGRVVIRCRNESSRPIPTIDGGADRGRQLLRLSSRRWHRRDEQPCRCRRRRDHGRSGRPPRIRGQAGRQRRAVRCRRTQGHRQRPAVEHTPGAIDLSYGDARTQLDGLCRGAVGKTKFTINTNVYRPLRCRQLLRELGCHLLSEHLSTGQGCQAAQGPSAVRPPSVQGKGHETPDSSVAHLREK